MIPPAYIDNAKVLKWAWSGTVPFGYIPILDSPLKEEVYGLAICQYEGSDHVYLFSCDRNWETLQDGPYNSVVDATRLLSDQYKNVEANWLDGIQDPDNADQE